MITTMMVVYMNRDGTDGGTGGTVAGGVGIPPRAAPKEWQRQHMRKESVWLMTLF